MNSKVFAAFCALAFVGELISAQGVTEDPQNDPKCPEVWDQTVEVFLPNRSNCTEYFHCVHGTPVQMACPHDLYWDQSMQFCNFPYLIDPPCPDTVMDNYQQEVEHFVESKNESKAPCWGRTYERCAKNCESVVPDIGLEICKFACRQACPKK